MVAVIDSDDKLAAVLARIRAAAWLGVDTEADSLHAYPEKLCLVQLSLPGADMLVDPLARIDLGPFWAALGGRELILHGADYDLRLLARSGFIPHGIFDTMLAARLVGMREFGLTNLAGHYLGVRLEKGPQRANWAKRPLTPRMSAYALNDTRHLKPLADILRARLVELNRLAWHQETCAQLVEVCSRPQAKNRDTEWRVAGANRLEARSLAVVRELWQWRDQEARVANMPPFFILSHQALLALATAAGQDGAVESLIPARYSPRRRTALLKAVERALALPKSKLPEPWRPQGYRLNQAQRQRLGSLRACRDRQGTALNLDPSLIASRATLATLARDWDKHAPELLPWQRDLLRG
jgi:ribonuclease D